jgi:hypothetical protein
MWLSQWKMSLLKWICWQFRRHFHCTRYMDARTEIALWKATPKLAHPACKSKTNKISNVRITLYWGAFVQPLLQGKAIRIIYFECVFVALGIRVRGASAVLHCLLCPVWLYHIFPHYLLNVTISRKRLLNIKCVLISSTNFVWNTSHSKKNSARHHVCKHVSM